MRIAVLICSGLLLGLACSAPVHGDFVVFKVPTTKIKFILQGKTIESRNQPTVNLTHISKQIFDLPTGADTEVIVVPPISQIGSKRLLKAKGNESQLRETAVWCLEHGLLPEFYRAIDQLAAVNSSEPLAVEVKRLKEELVKPLADTAAAEADLLKEYGGSTGKVVKTAHIILVHNGEKPDKNEIRRKRPEARAEQLEQLLEVFIMKCAERGLQVRVPTQPLKVAVVTAVPKKVLPGNRTAPLDKNIFWATNHNVMFIDERTKVPSLDALKRLQGDVAKKADKPKKKAGGAPAGAMPGGGGADPFGSLSVTQLAKLTVSLQALMQIGVENYELESTSREAAYMFLTNCGVITPEAPRWIQDGLAAFFEFPAEMGWVKVGDLGQIRQAWYFASLKDADRITITDIITGQLHDEAQTANATMRADTQAWALTHFLLQTKPEGVVQYLASFHSMPPDLALGEEVLTAMFDQAFDGDRSGLESSWREYMTSWKPDYQVLQEEEGGGSTSTSTESAN